MRGEKVKFYTKPPLRYFYRYALLGLLIVLPVFIFIYFAEDIGWRNIWIDPSLIGGMLFLLLLVVGGIILVHFAFWEKCFATLTITEDEVIWRCPFRKTRRLPVFECRYIGVELEESANGLPYPFIYLTSEPYPYEYRHKINKLRCSDSFIKFWYSEKLSDHLRERFPGMKTGSLLAYQIKQKKSRRK